MVVIATLFGTYTELRHPGCHVITLNGSVNGCFTKILNYDFVSNIIDHHWSSSSSSLLLSI